jgi:hypothetical protein
VRDTSASVMTSAKNKFPFLIVLYYNSVKFGSHISMEEISVGIISQILPFLVLAIIYNCLQIKRKITKC